MFTEIQQLEPERRHFLVTPDEFGSGSALGIYRQLRRRFRAIASAWRRCCSTTDGYRALRRAAFLLAPTKILAYNQRLERHHLRAENLHRVVAVSQRRAAGPDLSAPEMAGAVEKRPFGLSFRGPGNRRAAASRRAAAGSRC